LHNVWYNTDDGIKTLLWCDVNIAQSSKRWIAMKTHYKSRMWNKYVVIGVVVIGPLGLTNACPGTNLTPRAHI